MSATQQFTFTAETGVTYSSYQKIGRVIPGSTNGPASPPIRSLRVFAYTSQSSGADVIVRFILRDATRVIGYKDATLTVGAVRTGLDGASGNYLCTAVFADTSRDVVDLMGSFQGGGSAWWAVGLQSDGSLTVDSSNPLVVEIAVDCDI